MHVTQYNHDIAQTCGLKTDDNQKDQKTPQSLRIYIHCLNSEIFSSAPGQ